MQTFIEILALIGTLFMYLFFVLGFFVTVFVVSAFFLIPNNEGHELDTEDCDTTDYSEVDEDELMYGGRL